jgi:hypothetical protein
MTDADDLRAPCLRCGNPPIQVGRLPRSALGEQIIV